MLAELLCLVEESVMDPLRLDPLEVIQLQLKVLDLDLGGNILKRKQKTASFQIQ